MTSSTSSSNPPGSARHLLSRLLLLGLVTTFVNGAIVVLVPPDPHSYFAAFLDKERLLATTQAPRVLLVGGSNVAFGIDSEALEAATGLPVVNLGLHANLGLRLMLRQAEMGVRSGDHVLLVPEYQHFTGSPLDGSPKELAAVFEFDHNLPRLFSSPGQYWTLLLGLPQLEPSRLVWIQRALGQGPDLVYRRDAFNAHGDVVSHLGLGNGDGGTRRLFLPGESRALVDEAFNLVSEAVSNLQSLGGKPLITYPSISTKAYVDSATTIVKIQSKLEAMPMARVLGSPQEYGYLLPPDRFYDSPYHLTRKGRQERTQRLIEHLRMAGLATTASGPHGGLPDGRMTVDTERFTGMSK